ncbi:MAG: DUF3575 domain-containing protein [Cytophagales bacterium]|nr:DUF3575 domain-containing protein [Cytophagales bacterium]
MKQYNNITIKIRSRFIAATAIMLLFTPFLLTAQNDTIFSGNLVIHKDNTLKLSPFHFITSTFMIGLEHTIGKNRTIQLLPGVTFAEESNIYNAKDVFGLSVEVHYRIYLEKGAKRLMGLMNNKLSGLYGAPYLFYKQISMDKKISYFCPDNQCSPGGIITENEFVEAWSVGGGLIMGYQFIVNNVAVLDVFGGGGVKYSQNNIKASMNGYITSDNSLLGFNTGVVPNFGFLLGVYF